MRFSDWASSEQLKSWLVDATSTMLEHVSDFDEDDPRWVGPYLPIVNPPIWEIAHAAWFAEWFVLRQLHGRAPILEVSDALYDSAQVPHLTRWQLNYPSPQTTKDYVQAVTDGLLEVLADDQGLDSTDYFTMYAITHYDAHNEALAYTRQTLGWGAPTWQGSQAPQEGLAVAGDRKVQGGTLLLGASREQPFVIDNERWAHKVEVADFSMAAAPVTNSDFSAFVHDGGYSNPAVWSPQGWAWRESVHATQPVYWRGGPDGWEHRRMDQWYPLADHQFHPVVHVSWYEAEAFATWAGRRLPTEAEWEMAATTGTDQARQPWFPWGDRHPTDAEAALNSQTAGTVPVGAKSEGDGPWGHRQLIGNVWEWTASDFGPYPHFEPDAYRDNSEPWFGSRKVLRGGSWATQSRYLRSTFRNYFTPDRRDVIAGFRTCAS